MSHAAEPLVEPAAIVILGAAVDQQTMDLLTRVDRIPQVQTFRLQWAIIHAIEQALARPVDVLATVPTRDWPFTRKIWFGGRRSQRSEVRDQKSEGEDRGSAASADLCPLASALWLQMPMVNLLGLKQVSRFVAASWYLTKWLLRHRGQRLVIVSYGVIVPHLLPAAILKTIFGAKLVGILTDAPLNYHDEPAVYRAARWLDRRLLRMALAQLDGVIALTKPLADRFAPRAAACIMEGIVSDDVAWYAGKRSEIRDQRSEIRGQRSEDSGQKTEDGSQDSQRLSTVHSPLSTSFSIMYAGQLHADYGVKVLLDAFRSLDGEQFRLELYGQGTLEDEIRSAARADARINYHGFQPADVIFPAMREASVMVVPRFPDDHMANYSFPSKLLEYMAMGRIVICAKLPSIPADYYPHLVLVDNMTAPALAQKIQEVASWSLAARQQMEKDIREFVWANKTQLQQGRRIVAFLEQVRAA